MTSQMYGWGGRSASTVSSPFFSESQWDRSSRCPTRQPVKLRVNNLPYEFLI